MYSVSIDVLLKHVVNTRSPTAILRFNQEEISIVLGEPCWYSFNATSLTDSSITLEIEHFGKLDSDTDPATGADMAIIVEQIKVNGIASPRFVWAGVYRPKYPPHMSNQPAEVKYCNYLGWNGVWSLDITLPSFVWIHNIENLCWIYN